jgi:glycosyltransferase involved in cell wall biosynthesis
VHENGSVELSVVIPTMNRADALRDCLEAVEEASRNHSVEILVMDQSDGNDTRELAETRGGHIQYHRMTRRGACPARNLGAAIASGPLIAFLDDDCAPAIDWVDKIVRTFREDLDLMFVFGQLIAPRQGDHVAGWYPEYLPSMAWQEGRSRRKIAMVAAGANMVARQDFLFRIGGFDELLGPDVPSVKSNDSSISYKVLRSGASWRADPEIEVVHVNGFRPHAQLARLQSEYDHGLGVNWGRFVRRGDWRALGYFLAEQGEMTLRLLAPIVRLRRPRAVKNWLAHVRGFVDGLRLPGDVGYVDGTSLREMSRSGSVDPLPAP